MMMKRILGNLWLWVVLAFVLVIVAWVFTIIIAKDFDFEPIGEEENIERQSPTEPTEKT